jgi:hypothetical protein
LQQELRLRYGKHIGTGNKKFHLGIHPSYDLYRHLGGINYLNLPKYFAAETTELYALPWLSVI